MSVCRTIPPEIDPRAASPFELMRIGFLLWRQGGPCGLPRTAASISSYGAFPDRIEFPEPVVQPVPSRSRKGHHHHFCLLSSPVRLVPCPGLLHGARMTEYGLIVVVQRNEDGRYPVPCPVLRSLATEVWHSSVEMKQSHDRQQSGRPWMELPG